jgi:hypothetical protein
MVDFQWVDPDLFSFAGAREASGRAASRTKNSKKTAKNSDNRRCFFAPRTRGGPGFLPLSSRHSLIISGKNSEEQRGE